MALKSSADVGFLLIGGRSCLGVTTALADIEEAILEETTPLGVGYDTYGAVGVSKWEITQDGFYDAGSESANEAAELGDAVLMYAGEGNTVGADFLGCEAVQSTYAKTPARAQFTKANARYMSDGGPDRGIVSHPLGAETTETEVTTASDNGAQTTSGAIGYLGVTALTLDDATGLTVVIRDSADDVTYADLITFDAVTSLSDALRAQRKIVAGTVERYTLTLHTFTGSPVGSYSSTFATGLART